MGDIKNMSIQGDITISPNENNITDNGNGILFTNFIKETTLANGIEILDTVLKVKDTGTSSIFKLINDIDEDVIFELNSSTNISNGGAKSFRIVNNSGDSLIHSRGGKGMTISETSGNIFIDSLTDAIDSSTASLILSGGISVNKSILIQKEISALDGIHSFINTQSSENVLKIKNTSSSGRSSIFFLDNSDSVKLSLGYGNNLVQSPLNGTAYVQSQNGSPLLFRGDSTDSFKISTDGSLDFFSTTSSTSTSSGSLRILGGVGISNNVDASSFTNGGSLSLGGGAAIAKKLYVGGSLNLGTFIDFTNETLPGQPSSGKSRLYLDSSDGFLKSKNSSNDIKIYNPSTTKGDLITHNGSVDVRFPTGSNNLVLHTDSSTTSGLVWKSVSSVTPEGDISKYFEGNNSSSQTISSSYNPISLNSTRVIDDSYTKISNDTVRVLKSGTYIVLGKVTTSITSGSSTTNCSIVLSLDSSNVQGTTSYMLNINDDEDVGLSTACFSCILELTALQELKIMCKIDSGSSSISTFTNGCNLLLIRADIDSSDGSKYFNGYSDTSTTLSSSFSDIDLNVNRVLESSYIHTIDTPNVEFTESGKYFITYSVGFSKTSGNDKSNTETQLLLSDTSGLNFALIPGSLLHTYHEDNGNFSSTSSNIILDISSGQEIKIQSKILSGSNIQGESDSIQLCISKFQTTLENQSTVKFIDIYNTNSIEVDDSYTDITFNTNRISNSIFTHTLSSADITVNESGKYIIMCKTSFENDPDHVGHDHTFYSAQLRLLLDSGSGYLEISGSLSCNYIEPLFFGTSLQSFIILPMNVGDKIKMQGIRLGGSGTDMMTTISNSTSMSILKLDDEIISQNNNIIFGAGYDYIEDLTSSSTTSTSFVEKLTLTTDSIDAGTYRIGLLFSLNISKNGGKIGTDFLLDSVSLDESEHQLKKDHTEIVSIFRHVELSQGIHTIILKYKKIKDNPTISNSIIELWRVK